MNTKVNGGARWLAVAADDQGVSAAPVVEFDADPGPGLNAFGGLDPNPDHVFYPIKIDANVHGPALDLVAVANLDHQSVQTHGLVDLFQAAVTAKP